MVEKLIEILKMSSDIETVGIIELFYNLGFEHGRTEATEDFDAAIKKYLEIREEVIASEL